MNKSEWQEDVIPYQCLKLKIERTPQGLKINGITTKSIPDAQSIVEMA
jgi:hypothetical protein